MNAIWMVVLAVVLNGCGAMYGNEQEYWDGDFYNFADPDELAEIQNDRISIMERKMALAKLRTITPDVKSVNGVSHGFRGVIVNFSRKRLNVKVRGPEKKSYFMGPGERVVDYLVPGSYKRTLFERGKEIATQNFVVSNQQHSFQGALYHWYIYLEN